MIHAIEFEESTHIYRLDGQIIPSVTQIANQSKGFYKNAKEAADRGTRIHEAAAYLDSIGVSILDVDDDIHGYVRAWQNFLLRTNAKIKMIESIVFHAYHKFAGTMDRLLEISVKNYVVDLKSGSSASWHPYQLAGYAIALSDRKPELKVDGGIVVYLKDNGKFTTKIFEGVSWGNALETFKVLLAKFKESHK